MAKFSAPCLAILKEADPNASDKTIRERLARLVKFYKGESDKMSVSTPQEVRNFVLAHAKVRKAEIQKRTIDKLLNQRVDSNVARYLRNFTPEETKEALTALLVGANPTKLKESGFFTIASRDSAEGRIRQLNKRSVAGLQDELEANDVLDVLVDGKRDSDLVKAFFVKYTGKIDKKIDPRAMKAAEIILKYNTKLTNRLKRSGALIDDHPSSMFSITSHDQGLVSRVPFREWVGKIHPLLDRKTFSGSSSDIDFLTGLYADIKSGTYIKSVGAEDNIDVSGTIGSNGFLNPDSISRRNRVRFLNAESQLKYMEEFSTGNKSLSESVFFSFEHKARAVVLTEMLGTDPKKTLIKAVNNAKKELSKKHSDLVETDLKADDSGLPPFISNRLKEVDGSTRQIMNPTYAKLGSVTRILKNMAVLGNVVLTSVNDISFIFAEARFQGIPAGTVARNLVSTFTNSVGTDSKEVAKLMGIGIDGLVGDLLSRSGSDLTDVGSLSRWQRIYFKANLLTPWNDALKSMSARMMSSNIASKANLSKANLDFETNRLLDLFNISDSDWDLFRRTKYTLDGDDFMTADRISELSDEEVAKHLFKTDKKYQELLPSRQVGKGAKDTITVVKQNDSEPSGVSGQSKLATSGVLGKSAEEVLTARVGEVDLTNPNNFKVVPKNAIDEFRDTLSDKIGTMFIDRNDFFIAVPGGREKAIFHQGTQRGTVLGELTRFMMQFKTFPVTVLTRPLATISADIRQKAMLRGKASGTNVPEFKAKDFAGLAQFVGGMTFLGYIGQAAKDIFKGREPRDPLDPSTTLDAMRQSGVLGIYSDFILSPLAEPHFFKPAMQALGPVLGSFEDIAEVTAKAMAGDDVAIRTYNILLSWTPFSNIFYTKLVFDSMAFNSFQEFLSPGYLSRLERTLKKSKDQEFFVKPSRVTPRGGGSPLGNLKRLGKELAR